MFLYRTITHHNDTGIIARRKGGGQKRIKKNYTRINRQSLQQLKSLPRWLQKIAAELNMTHFALQRISNNELLILILNAQPLLNDDFLNS